MVQSSILGFPRVGKFRQLKVALENFWKKEITLYDLLQVSSKVRQDNWKMQVEAGIDILPVNDFSYYDHILDTCFLFGLIPSQYKQIEDDVERYFACARGLQENGVDVKAMEMTKWFDTNYHYLVPELDNINNLSLNLNKIKKELEEAKKFGKQLKVVIVGPLTLLRISKSRNSLLLSRSFLDKIVPLYKNLFKELYEEKVRIIQIDEPVLSLDLKKDEKQLFEKTYEDLLDNPYLDDLKIFIATYFGEAADNIDLISKINADGFHFDLVRGVSDVNAIIENIRPSKTISLGLVDGRNVWINDFEKSTNIIDKFKAKFERNLIISSSCSLLHTPVDLDEEKKLDKEIKSWLAFAKQKLSEIKILTDYANGKNVEKQLEENKVKILARQSSNKVNNHEVMERLGAITEGMLSRKSVFAKRKKIQKNILNLPLFPTTTIGSFPQTPELRKARAKFKKGDISEIEYNKYLQHLTVDAIKKQEQMDIDVLVHGEFERNDMVEYFGEQLDGFVFTENGWVQSYGSRCVKPPIIFGDVSRPNPMTLEWTVFAQKNTKKLVKAMLTGPVTILQWSFVRNDIERETVCKQIALAIRDEVLDLEAAGIKVIQIDEPAIREGLPLKDKYKKSYLKWAVDSFRLSAGGVKDETQTHTHMCYSEFNDIMDSIADMDADVLSIETSRSQMELLDAFEKFKYPNEIGPGVYDIHSPRIPTKEEMVQLIKKAVKLLPKENIWVNPDCGLKTRGWKEVEKSLANMVLAAKEARKVLH